MLANKAIVISLDTRPDRLDAFRERWEAIGSPVPLEVWTATRGSEDDLPAQWRHLGVGAHGCYASHTSLLFGQPEPVLVLEDDVVFGPHFLDALAMEPPEDADLIYLGGQWVRPLPVTQGIELHRMGGVLRTHAYVARNPRAIFDVLRLGGNQGRHVDQVIRDSPLRMWGVLPWQAGQDASESDVGVERRRAEPTFWHDPVTWGVTRMADLPNGRVADSPAPAHQDQTPEVR